MEIREILKKVDHTLLAQTAPEDDIKNLLDDGMKYNVASCCIPPFYVPFAKKHVGGRLKICTVIGFPNGYNDVETKVFETAKAVSNGADEIDMVINIAALKNKDYGYVEEEIRKIKAACSGKILKVIVETCLLSEEEKIAMCRIVTESGGDFIKTSTGFSTGGATFDDIALFKKYVGEGVCIKASGGIASLEDAINFVKLGADRLGTSRLVKIAKEMGI